MIPQAMKGCDYIQTDQSSHIMKAPPPQLAGSNPHLHQYFLLKHTTALPPAIAYIFTTMERVIELPQDWARTLTPTANANHAFLAAFAGMSQEEQGLLLSECAKFVVRVMCGGEGVGDQQQVKYVETTVQIYASMLAIPMWYEYGFRLDKVKRVVLLTRKKSTEEVDLNKYLVRWSKKYARCIVLQGLVRGSPSKYILSFKNNVGEEVYRELFRCMIEIKQKELQVILETSEEGSNPKKTTANMVFLSSQNINQFLNYKDTKVKEMMTQKYEFRHFDKDKQWKIETASKGDKKLFKFEAVLSMQCRATKENFITNFSTRKSKLVLSSEVAQNFSGRYFAVYEKYLIDKKIQELITIRQQNLSDSEDVLFMKGMRNMVLRNFLEFLLVKVKDNGRPDQSKLLIVMEVELNQLIRAQVIRQYLLTLYQCVLPAAKTSPQKPRKINSDIGSQQKQQPQSTQQAQQAPQEQFYTVCGNNFGDELYMQFVQGQQAPELNLNGQLQQYKSKSMSLIPYETINEPVQTNYLKYRHRTEPYSSADKHGMMMTEHYLFKDWTRKKEGGVVCNNVELVNTQKRMFKDVITAFGNQILKGGSNVLNISLPVTVFKKQSHLESIARDFCYAPLFFDRGVTDSLERVKFASLLAISVGTLGISMEKPFNPLLGETLQAWIGGCPIYLEQVSHHPPIGSYYFLGRGYKIHGLIEPKISFGINNVKGFSERSNYIIFDDGTTIEMIYGKMIIHGLLFGEREFNFEDKIFAYDKTNGIFSEISYGPRRKGMLSKSSEPWDYCYGKIYKVKQQFRTKFQSTKPRLYPTKQYIIKELSSFQGVWNEAIIFDGVQYVNFRQELPFDVEKEQFPLPSNSLYRKDLIRLLEGNIKQSQKEKQLMEEIQRRDRRGREKYKSNGKLEQVDKENQLAVEAFLKKANHTK